MQSLPQLRWDDETLSPLSTSGLTIVYEYMHEYKAATLQYDCPLNATIVVFTVRWKVLFLAMLYFLVRLKPCKNAQMGYDIVRNMYAVHG